MHSLLKGLVTVTGVLVCLAASTSAQADGKPVVPDPQDPNVDPDPLIARDDVAQGIGLRILPLGASIMAGDGSSDGNGFRRYLEQKLAGSKIQYVGSLRSGSMSNNYHEGHSGFGITQVADAAVASIDFRPNIILFPDATILLAQLVAARDPGHNTRIAAYNSHMSSLASSRAGKHIILVDMTIITAAQLTADGIHPNDAAYEIMASQWHKGIQNAVARGWVKDPIGPDPQPDPNNPNQNCINRRSLEAPEPRGLKTGHQCATGVNWSQVGKIARGDGANGDHKFSPSWIRRGGAGDPLSRDGSRIVFADLRGTGRSDRVLVAAKDGTLFAWLNNGDGTNIMWEPANDGKQIFDGKCILDRMRLADLTDSGKADVVCIVGTNSVEAYFNQYTPSGGFRWDGPHQISNGVAGANRDSIYFMDVDGNGRDDMVVKRPNGGLHAMLNFGKAKDISNIDWHDVGQIAPSIGTSNIAFADLNNDGRDDIVAFNGDGSMYGFLNIRGLEAGRPMWVRQDEIKGTEDWAPADLRISDVTGDGKADYIHVDQQNGDFDLFVNDGIADVNVVGDGTWLADMDGDGLDDRVWITEDGRISVWLNGQANAQAPFGWDWFAQNNQQPVVSGINAKREQYRLADIDGDGKADLVVIELKTGAISAWLNNGPDTDASPQGWGWAPVGQIGVSVANAANAHFADVTGDGKADLIWLDEASMLTIYRNDYDSSAHHWSWPKSTETPIDLRIQNPRDIRFADIDGDQKADAIVIHPWDGAAVVWLNRDSTRPEGWVRSVPSPGSSDPSHPPCAGDNVLFARVSVPYGRADYVIIDPSDGALSLWKNGCRNYAPGSSSMTDNPKNDIMSRDTNQQKAPSVSCGDLIVPAGGADSQKSTITTSWGFPGKTLISKRATASPVLIIENSNGQLQVPVSPAPSLVAKPPSPGSQTNPTNGKPSAAVVAGGRTLTPGAAPVIISGTTYSLASTSRPMVVVNGATSTLPTLQAAVTGSGGSISGSLVSGQRTPSRSATISSGFLAVVPRPISTRTVTPYPLVVVIGSDTIGVQSTGFVAGGRTVKPGSAITFSGRTLSLDSQSAKLIEDGTTITIPTRRSKNSTATPIRPSLSPGRPSPIIVGSETIHPESLTSTGFIIGNQTIRPGASSTTILGQEFSLDSSANLHVGTSTIHVGSQNQGTSTTSVSTSTITDFAALNDTASNDTDIYVPAGKWDELAPEIAIAAAAVAAGGLINLILPPRRLRVPTTIKFPPYTTSLEIAWQEVKEIESGGKKFLSTKFESMTQRTTLSIPSMVTDREEYWNIRLPKGLKATKVFPTPSYQPRPFIIEENRNPLNQKGVRHPLVRRTITPPSWPYSVPTKFPDFPPAVNIVSQAADQLDKPWMQRNGKDNDNLFRQLMSNYQRRPERGSRRRRIVCLDHVRLQQLQDCQHQCQQGLWYYGNDDHDIFEKLMSYTASCPTVSLDPNEDQGEDGKPSIRPTSKVSTTSKSSASTKASSSTKSSTTKPSSSPTSSTSKPPSSPPLKTSPPPTYTEPPLPIYQFAVGWFLEGVFGKGTGYSKNAIYFDKYSEDAQWVCRDDTALWEQEKNGPRSPKYPIVIGPFDAQPWTDCAYYRESDNTDGLLTCVGNRYRQDGKCKAVDEGNKIECSEAAEKKSIRWTTQQVCTMEGGLSGGEVNPDTGPEFCYNATFNGEPAVGTVTTIHKDAMNALIDDSCDKAKDWKFETFKDLRGNPTMRLEMTSAVKEGKKQPKWSKKNCKNMFGQLNIECSLYGGAKESNDILMHLAAYDRPAPPPPPAPPLVPSTLDDECFNATWAGGSTEKGTGRVLTRRMDRAAMGRFIHDTCHKADDEDILEEKAADTAILALVAKKGIKGAKVKWEKRVCPDRFGQVIVD
ncbi:MAG: hypothetical protein Q9197_004527, partial [Variospora fuerteventurae]